MYCIKYQLQIRAIALAVGFALTLGVHAQTAPVIELETTTITGNTELPKFLYVLPWQERKSTPGQEQKLALHNLYDDLFDPVLPDYIPADRFRMNLPGSENQRR